MPDIAVSVITQVETLGYHQLTADEKLYLIEFFANVERLPVSEFVVEEAIAPPTDPEDQVGRRPDCGHGAGTWSRAGDAEHG